MKRSIAALAIAGLMASATMPAFGGDGFGYTSTSSRQPPKAKGLANRKQKRKEQKIARRKNRAKK